MKIVSDTSVMGFHLISNSIKSRRVRLVYWQGNPNFGDLLSPYIVTHLCDCRIIYKRACLSYYDFVKCIIRYPTQLRYYVPPFQKNLVAVGSILNLANSKSIIWGAGFMNEGDSFVVGMAPSAVRGRYTENKILSAGGSSCGIYGDPALLLPLIYNPKIEKKNRIGIIPHWRETDRFKRDFPEYYVIDLQNSNVEETINKILSCDRILSTSLHGLIAAHAYGIPALWIKDGYINTDGFKFKDYFSSVDIEIYDGFADIDAIMESESQINALFIRESSKSLPNCSLNEIQNQLLAAAPFPLREHYACR